MAAQKGIGRLVQFGIAKETVRGTPETAASYYIPVSDFSIDEKDNRVLDEQARGIIEDSVSESIVKQWVEGQFTAPIGDKHFPLVLYSLLGTLTSADNADSDASIKDHTIVVAQSAQHQALSLFVDDPLAAQDYKHGLGMITSLEIKYEKGKFIEYTVSFKAKKGSTATLTPANTSSESRFLPQHLVFKMASAQSGLSGASAVTIKSASLKFTPNVEDDDVMGSLTPADFLNKQFSVEGTVEALWQNESDYKTASLLSTIKAMRFDLINTDVTIGSAANPEIKIDLHAVNLQPVTRAIKLNDLVMQTVNFKAHYSLTDSKMITVVATNAVASY